MLLINLALLNAKIHSFMHNNNIYFNAHSIRFTFREHTVVIFYYSNIYSITPRLFPCAYFLHSYIFYRIKITELEVKKFRNSARIATQAH